MDEIIDSWLNDAKKDLINNYDRLGLRASGAWATSLNSFQQEKNNKIRLGITGNDYTEQLENGRRPNQNQSPEALKAWVGWAGSTFLDKWVSDKGIDINPYAVAWKIAKEGWIVPNPNNAGGLISDVITPSRIEKLSNSLILQMVNNFRSDIRNILK